MTGPPGVSEGPTKEGGGSVVVVALGLDSSSGDMWLLSPMTLTTMPFDCHQGCKSSGLLLQLSQGGGSLMQRENASPRDTFVRWRRWWCGRGCGEWLEIPPPSPGRSHCVAQGDLIPPSVTKIHGGAEAQDYSVPPLPPPPPWLWPPPSSGLWLVWQYQPL